ncbi:MAG TPA: hypothetical protein VHZ24_02110 [Pirellulales bacterium]|jgi:hypothetical protein|nr:hypothetical protein [Pirellulales bacterium]
MSTNDCLELILEPMASSFSAEFARKLVDLRTTPALQQRLDELAQKANEGALSLEEQAEYRSLVDASTIVAIMQASARRYLAEHAA